MFITTSMHVGGAETLLVNLVRRLDRARFAPELACLKEPGPLGETLKQEMPVHSHLLVSKYDLRILPRLWRLLRSRQIDAVVTVGAGDKMFWGRLTARLAGVRVVISALHSTGWPDTVGRLNRLLTPLTDAFIGVADAHAEYLTATERFPRKKIFTIHNGVDTEVFTPGNHTAIREALQLAVDVPLVGILAALRPEKNHELFLAGAARVTQELLNAKSPMPPPHYVVIGDGEQRSKLEKYAQQLGIDDVTHFLGSRCDVANLLPGIDVVALTSHNEASPVSILEALSCSVPVVASRVGSIPETVIPGITGALFEPGDLEGFVAALLAMLQDPSTRTQLGRQGRQHVVEHGSLISMVEGYETLIEQLHARRQYEATQHQRAQRIRENRPNLRCTAQNSKAGFPTPVSLMRDVSRGNESP